MADVNNPIANLSIEDLIQSAEGPKPTTYSPLISDKNILGGIGSFYKTLSDSFNKTQDAKKGMGLGIFNLFKQAGNDIGDGATNINAGMSNAGMSNAGMSEVDLRSIDEQVMDYIPTDDFLGMPIDSNIIDSYTEQSVMGMAPPVGDPVKARALKEAETKKAIDDEAALNKREKALGDTKIDSAPSSTEDLFSSAMQDVIASVRGTGPDTPEQKTIDDYKKEFSEATGIDVSGKVDKSAALMAMGLSLMQNKAGKGFNVGKMLSAVGEAGEKALPALTAAKKEAKVSAAQAGKYAIEMRSADEAKRTVAKEKMMARENYYLVPKGEGISGQVDNILAGKGSLENLNKYELSKLMENPKFSSKFDILPGSSWEKIVQEVMKTPEAAELYDTKTPRKIELLGEGASDMFTIETWRALPNSGVESKLVGTGQSTYEGLSRAARDIALAKEKFATGLGLTKNVSVFNFTLDKIDSLASAFGVNVKSGTNDTEKLKLFLTKLQAQNAKEILGEAGKTISDADRALVKSIVGDVTLFSNTDLLQQKVSELFTEIVVKKERQIFDALRTLDRFSGSNVSSRLDSGTLSEEEQAELEKYLASPEFSQGKK